jgi:hypothetical protein
MNTLKSEVELEHKCLAEKEIKIKEKLEKVMFFYPECSAAEIRILLKLHCMSCQIQFTLEPD